MKLSQAKKIMETEQECVRRQGTIKCPDRDCAKCDLLLPTETVLEAYSTVIAAQEQPIGQWLITKSGTAGWETVISCVCSNCKSIALKKIEYDMDGVRYEYAKSSYCPNCGARMDGQLQISDMNNA